MSRKWERMVQKNMKTIQKQRSKQKGKQGRTFVDPFDPDAMISFKGRSWFFPMFLIAFSVFFILTFYQVYGGDTTYWLTGILYFSLGLFLFFLRRPYIRIGRDKISTRRFTGEKFVDADQIDFISIVPGTIIIQMKEKKERWVFSRMLQRFDIDEIETHLKKFAERHKINLT